VVGLDEAWRRFAVELWPQGMGAGLMQMWQLAGQGDLLGMRSAEAEMAQGLPLAERERSLRAGKLLLRTTDGARYQGILGKVREAVKAGECEGHFFLVWPVVSVLFQLTPAAMLAEYVRMEWETATRGLPGIALPEGRLGVQRLVQAVLQPDRKPRMVAQRLG
jgi:urease accessory protein UreF